MDREGLAVCLRLCGNGGSGCNVFGSSNVVGQNVVEGAGLGIIMVGMQIAADTTLNFQHAKHLLVHCLYMERVAWHRLVVFKQYPHL